MKTLIKGGYVVGFDGQEHKVIRDGEVVFEGSRIVYVGKSYPQPVDETIDAKGKLVCPGFINTHVHASNQATEKVIADSGHPELFNSGFLNYIPVKGKDAQFSLFGFESPEVGGKFSLVNLLKSGSTTFVEVGSDCTMGDIEKFVEVCGEVGMRAYLSPGYSSGHWYYDSDSHLKIHWDEERALEDLEKAKTFIKTFDGAVDGRIRGILLPIETVLSTPKLLQETRQAADELDVGITTHNSEALMEFYYTVNTHGVTPVEYLWQNGLLGPDVILGHCVLTNVHSATYYAAGRDLELLAESGASVAHCPLSFARRGVALESFDRYMKAGINMAIGTDTYPLDIIGEMRLASLVCKIVERDFTVGRARDMFNAATLGGARALKRDDLGRLAPGAKADILVIDLTKPHIGAVRDPIKALVNGVVGDDVERVIIDGRTVVQDGRVVGVEEEKLMVQAQEESEKIWAAYQQYDWQERGVDELSPLSFELVEDLGSDAESA
ncbi:MAG: chlorohydrolase family protein [Dehalococcoidia bacterium]